MALKPTIYRAQVTLADTDRMHFEDFAVTLARHPSETLERTAVRLLAFCLDTGDGLEFGRGLSTAEEPALWRRGPGGDVELWIEVGQPEESRLRKACGRASRVKVYAFGRGAGTWWAQNREALEALPRLEIHQLEWEQIVALAALLGRTVQLTVTIAAGVVYVDNGSDSVSLEPLTLLRPS